MDNIIEKGGRNIEVVTNEIKSLVSSAQSVMLGYAVEIGRRRKTFYPTASGERGSAKRLNFRRVRQTIL